MKIRSDIMRKRTVIDKRYFLMYCRKSSEAEDRQAESIPDQLNTLNKLAKSKNIAVLKEFKESHSAKAPGRPLFDEMVSLLESREDIKGLLCWKLNRLFRNPKDEGLIRWFLQSGRILEIITPNKVYLEADSDFQMAVEGAQSQRFITDLRQDTKRGIDSKLQKGNFPGLAPIGYRNNTQKKQGEKDISPSPIYFKLMRKVFELAMTGNFSIQALVGKSEELGVVNWRGKAISKSQMHEILRNPFYTGKFLYAGNLYQGTHQPMLSEEEFDLLQDIITGKSHPRKVKHNFTYASLIQCGECGMMICEEKHIKVYKSGKTQDFIYDRCTKKNKNIKCSQPYIRSSELEKQIIEFLGSLELSLKFASWAMASLNKANKSQQDVREARYKALKASYEAVLGRIDNLLDLKLSPLNNGKNILSDEEFAEKKQALMEEKIRLHDELSKVDQHVEEWTELAAKTFDFTVNIQERFRNGSVDDKRTILRAIGSNLILKDKRLYIKPRTPFLLIREVSKKINENNWLEPVRKADTALLSEGLFVQNTTWGGQPESNRQHSAPQADALTVELWPPRLRVF